MVVSKLIINWSSSDRLKPILASDFILQLLTVTLARDDSVTPVSFSELNKFLENEDKTI